MYLSVCLPVRLSVYLPIYLSIYPVLYLFVDLLIYLFIYLSIRLSVYLFIYRSLDLSTYPSIDVPVCLAFPLFSSCLFSVLSASRCCKLGGASAAGAGPVGSCGLLHAGLKLRGLGHSFEPASWGNLTCHLIWSLCVLACLILI